MINAAGLPLVSAIIPTYNRSHLLVRAIDSVLNQSYANIELIIVDDGSTDNTQTVVDDFAKHQPDLVYVRKSNGGCASARNRGLEYARGHFIAFLDSDDEWRHTAIESLVSRLLETGADLVYSPSIEVYSDDLEEINYPVAIGQPEMLAKAHFMMTNVRNGSYMFARAALEKVGGLDESLKYNEDSDFFQRLSLCCRAGYSSIPTVRVHDHTGSKSRHRTEIYRALLRSSEKLLAENPSFAAQLGSDADVRLRQIKGQLVESLLFTGSLSEAVDLAGEVANDLRLIVRFGFLCRSNVPLKLENFSRGFFRALKKSLRRTYFPFQVQSSGRKKHQTANREEIAK